MKNEKSFMVNNLVNNAAAAYPQQSSIAQGNRFPIKLVRRCLYSIDPSRPLASMSQFSDADKE